MIRVPVAPGRNTNSVAVGIDNQKKVCAIERAVSSRGGGGCGVCVLAQALRRQEACY